MNKKGKIQTGTILLLAVVGIFLWQGGFLGAISADGECPAGTEQVDGQCREVISATCPDDGTTSFQVSAVNTESDSGISYIPTTFYLYQDGKTTWETTYTTAASSTRTAAINLECAKKYNMANVVDDGFDGTGETTTEMDLGLVTGATMIPNDIKLKNQTALEARVFYNDNNDWAFTDSGGKRGTWEPIEDPSAVLVYLTTNATSEAVAAGDSLDMTLHLRANTSNAVWGDTQPYMVIDADVDTWDEPDVRVNGASVADAYDALDSNDRAALSSYEYAYPLPQVSRDKVVVDFVLEPSSGINPAKNVTVYLVSSARHLGNDGVTIRDAIHKDDSSRTIQMTAQGWKFVLN